MNGITCRATDFPVHITVSFSSSDLSTFYPYLHLFDLSTNFTPTKLRSVNIHVGAT